MDNRKNTQLKVLLVEDNPGDVRLIQEIFKESELNIELLVAYDGQEALIMLRPGNADIPAIVPDLILLDLNLPRKDGRELLAEVKNDQALKRIPVVVLTSSSAEQDVLKVYDLHANCYVTKPVLYEDFARTVKAIEYYWLTVVCLPSRTMDLIQF